MNESPLHPDATIAPGTFLGEMLLSSDAQSAVESSANPRELLDALVERELFPDAFKVLALAMTPQSAVQWSLTCVRSVGGELNDAERMCLDAAEAWILDPDEAKRSAAAEAGRRSNYEHPAAWVAAAAGWTGGSIAPPGSPDVPPPPVLTPTAAAGAVGAAAGLQPPDELDAVRQRFFDAGLQHVNAPDVPSEEVRP